jgi:hypothetical protein
MLERRLITNLVLKTLEGSLEKPVGDTQAPTDPFGWTGQPDMPGSAFIPYLIVSPGATNDIKGPFADTRADIRLNYQLTGFGVSRDQCEWLMDKSREILDSLRKTLVDGGDSMYKVTGVSVKTLGGVSHGSVNEYLVFGQTDVLEIFLSKEF